MSQVLGKTGDIYIFKCLSLRFNSTLARLSLRHIGVEFWFVLCVVVWLCCVWVRVCNYQCECLAGCIYIDTLNRMSSMSGTKQTTNGFLLNAHHRTEMLISDRVTFVHFLV